MTRLFALPRRVAANPIPALFRHLVHLDRLHRDARHLDRLPHEQLVDMGIAPRSSANRRHAGEAGPRVDTQLW